jgi:1-acyl-sn-glycerol-3-phosphate acyltransferase
MMAALRTEGLWVDQPCAGGCAPGHRHFKVLATADVLNYPVTKQMAARSGVIPVGRDHGTAALLTARRALAAGELVVIYPEGDLSVTVDGAPREWRAGASVLARGVPVYPIAHHDSRTLGNGGENMALSIAFGLTRWTSPQLVRIFAGKPVLPDELAGLDPYARQMVLEASLRSTWEIARTGVLPA